MSAIAQELATQPSCWRRAVEIAATPRRRARASRRARRGRRVRDVPARGPGVRRPARGVRRRGDRCLPGLGVPTGHVATIDSSRSRGAARPPRSSSSSIGSMTRPAPWSPPTRPRRPPRSPIRRSPSPSRTNGRSSRHASRPPRSRCSARTSARISPRRSTTASAPWSNRSTRARALRARRLPRARVDDRGRRRGGAQAAGGHPDVQRGVPPRWNTDTDRSASPASDRSSGSWARPTPRSPRTSPPPVPPSGWPRRCDGRARPGPSRRRRARRGQGPRSRPSRAPDPFGRAAVTRSRSPEWRCPR